MKRILKRSLAIIAVLSCVPFLTSAGAGEKIMKIIGMGATQDSQCENSLGTGSRATHDACSGQRKTHAQPVFNQPTRFAFPMI